MIRPLCAVSLFILFLAGCKEKIKVTEDKVYSRHLQRHVKLSIYNTPVPKDKNSFNLLLLNDGQEAGQLRLNEILDSLNENELIQPLVVVAIHTSNRMKELGIADHPDYKNNGTDAKKYSAFVYDELYFFIKKKTGVRKFNSIIIAGWSLGGLSALDIAWDHADRINKVGVFSGSFWYRDRDASTAEYSDDKNRIMHNKIRSSRKRPNLKYWFYAGNDEEKNDRDKDGIIDVIDDAKDLVTIIENKKVVTPSDIVFTEVKGGKHDLASWRHAFPAFLIWAAGNKYSGSYSLSPPAYTTPARFIYIQYMSLSFITYIAAAACPGS